MGLWDSLPSKGKKMTVMLRRDRCVSVDIGMKVNDIFSFLKAIEAPVSLGRGHPFCCWQPC